MSKIENMETVKWDIMPIDVSLWRVRNREEQLLMDGKLEKDGKNLASYDIFELKANGSISEVLSIHDDTKLFIDVTKVSTDIRTILEEKYGISVKTINIPGVITGKNKEKTTTSIIRADAGSLISLTRDERNAVGHEYYSLKKDDLGNIIDFKPVLIHPEEEDVDLYIKINYSNGKITEEILNKISGDITTLNKVKDEYGNEYYVPLEEIKEKTM